MGWQGKVGDLGSDYTATLQDSKGNAFDWSASKYKGYISLENVLTPGTPDATLRDVTTYSKANSSASIGQFAANWYDGRTAPSTRTAAVTVTDKTVNGQITVTVAASGLSGISTQEIYMTKANDDAGTLYRVASGSDGFAAGGIDIGSATYPAADTDLDGYVQAHTDNRSAVHGYTAGGTPTTPTAALKGTPTAGSISNGTHKFVLVNKRASDLSAAATLNVTVTVIDTTTGNPVSWPATSFDQAVIEDGIS